VRIVDIHLSSFGHWQGLQICDLNRPVTVIYGPNEAGKSTLLQFVRAVLYGFSPQRHRRFVPPLHDGRVGGSLTLVAANGRYVVRRLLPPSACLEDHERAELSVRSVDGAVQGKQVLNSILSGIDDSLFHNVFSVGLTEIQHLGSLSDTKAAEQLYGLAMGTDRISLLEIRRDLEEARRRVIGVDGNASELPELLERRSRLRREVDTAPEDVRRWSHLLAEQNEVQQLISELEVKRRSFPGGGNLKQLTQALRDKWTKCQMIHDQLSKLGKVSGSSRQLLKKIEDLTTRIQQHRSSWETTKKQRRELSNKAAQTRTCRSLAEHTAEIERLGSQKSRFKSLQVDIDRLTTQIDEAEFELQSELERAGVKSVLGAEHLPLITDDVVNMLRAPAREAKEAREQIEKAEKAARQFRAEAERLQRQIRTGSAKLGNADFHDSIDELESKIALMRRRLQLDARLEKFKRHIKEVSAETQQWRERQVLPWRALMALGGLFSIGVAIVLAGFFGEYFGLSDDRRWTMSLIGVCVSLLTPIIKNVSEAGARRAVESCEDEIEELSHKTKTLQAECQKLDNQLGPSSQPLVQRLQDAERAWAELEPYLPLESQRDEATRQADAYERQQRTAEQELKDARQRWRETLRAAGLPDSITPSQVRQLTEQSSGMSQARQKLTAAREELDKRRRELDEIEGRVQTLVSLGQLVPEPTSLESQIDELQKAVRSHRQQAEKRDALHRQWRQLGREQFKIAQAAKRMQQQRTQLMKQCGVTDRSDAQRMLKLQNQSIELTQRRDSLIQEVAADMAGTLTPDDLLSQLAGNDFTDRLSNLETEYDDVLNQLNQSYERRAELEESVKALVNNRDLALKRLELSEIECRLGRAIDLWRTLALTSMVLDLVRSSYESERQPETLSEASGYLQRLTRDRYKRIWTPFGESILCVDDHTGRATPVESLSRGTREQVFLSLRLALASNYSSRGANLPLILDDVFVNFDSQRARAAAETICDFANQGIQVFVFTCHDHIRAIFEQLGVDIRTLPEASKLNAKVGPEMSTRAPVPIGSAQPTARPEPSQSAGEKRNSRRKKRRHTRSSAGDRFGRANEQAQFVGDDDFYGEDGTFYPRASVR
jgi:uncharacterized protein YhaN